MQVIGFGCTAQVGKDTAADYLEKKYPGRVKRVAFADKLKKIAMDLFGLTWSQCYGSQQEKESVDPRYGLTPREILQSIGEKMREIWPAIWVDTVFNATLPQLQEEGFDIFVISDVRYPNEGDKVHDHGGVVVKINRPGSGVTVGQAHTSETSMQNYEDFDFVIENNGSLEEFYSKVDQMMGEIIHGGETRRH